MWEEYLSGNSNSYVPVSKWGKDHWSTFAYLETRAVDHKGIVDNSRMRCNVRLHKEFAFENFGNVVSGDKYPTRLKQGELEKHDDWSCLEDMVATGLLRAFTRVKFHGQIFGNSEARVELTELGQIYAEQLRRHKMNGGAFATFEPMIAEVV